MFKSKIDFNAFDKNNKKVKDLDESKVKGLAKAGTKKLAGTEGEKTAFHLILDYFKDDKGKGLGHFLNFGENKKLSKHFEQVEMKSGKLDKSMSESPKKACMGEAYVKVVNGKKLVHIEPSAKSKIPQGQWPKILKSMKALFGGLKAVVVIGGQILDGGDGEEDPQATDVEETDPVESVGDAVESGIELIKGLFNDITDGLKNKLPQSVLPNIKAKNVSQDDLDATSALLENIESLKEHFEGAADDVKAKISKSYEAILKQLPKIEKVQAAVEKLLGIEEEEEETTDEGESEEAKALKELLDYMGKEMDNFDKNFSKLKEELANTASEVIAGGEDLLNKLF